MGEYRPHLRAVMKSDMCQVKPSADRGVSEGSFSSLASVASSELAH